METFTLQYRSDVHILELRWLRPTTMAETQASYQAALVLAQSHRCSHWLLDSRCTGPIEVSETTWLADVFLPAVAALFAPRPLRLAVFSSPLRLEQMRSDEQVRPVVARALAAVRPYEASVFADEATAVAWLGSPLG